jgi:hypothetical protein
MEFVKQLGTLHTTGTTSRWEKARTLARFARMFVGSLAKEYVSRVAQVRTASA